MEIPRCVPFSCLVAAAAIKENGPRADGTQGRKTSKKFGCQALFIDNTTWALVNRRKGV